MESEVNFFMTEAVIIKTSPMICSANQWTSFYMITASAMKELKILRDALRNGVLKLNYFHSITPVTLVLLMCKRMGLPMWKSCFLKCLNCFSLPNLVRQLLLERIVHRGNVIRRLFCRY